MNEKSDKELTELICTDYDETIAEKGEVNSRIINEIKSFVSKGGLFTIATGRMLRGLGNIVNLCNLPIICANGAIICDAKTEEVLYEKNIIPRVLWEVISQFEALITNIHVVCQYCSYDIVGNLHKFKYVNEKIYKVDLKCKGNIIISSLINAIQTCADLNAIYNRGNLTLEISASTKGDALRWILDNYNIQRKIIVIGNNDNDISMGAVSNVFYAVKNAPHNIKKNANIVLNSTNCNNPVAEVLARENGYYGFFHPILHFKTVKSHRREVYKLCKSVGITWRGILHDLSKYSPVEFLCGMKYYSGNSSPISLEQRIFGKSKAWAHHVLHNKHHSEYWITGSVNNKICLKMPTVYWVEQVCDRIASAKVYLGINYNNSSPYMRFIYEKAIKRMETTTAQNVEKALIVLSKESEESLLEYLRNILNKKYP